MKYLIDFQSTAAQADVDSWLTLNGATNVQLLSMLTNTYSAHFATTPVVTAIVEHLIEDVNISNQLLGTTEIIPSPSGETTTFDHDDEWWKTATAFKIDLTNSSSTFVKRGEKAVVYVVDSGIDTSHPDFSGMVVDQFFSFNNDFTDMNGHGTALASVIGGVAGISKAQIKSVKVFDDAKTTMTSDLVRAFDAIAVDIINSSGTIAIINLSWAIPKNPYIESKIQTIVNAGGYVVAAAGNSGVPIEDVTPASMDSVLTIGAFTEELQPADFSNYTSAVSNTQGETNHGALDAWAPGVNVRAALLNGGVGFVDGTSIAAAITTACFAYNADAMFSDDDHSTELANFLEQYSLSKTDILQLDGKYSTSVNKIVSFMNDVSDSTKAGTYSITHIVYAGQDVFNFIANNQFVEKIELDGDLPDGLSLAKGWIVGQLINPPTISEKREYVATITFVDGVVKSFRYILYVVNQATPIGDTPTDITPFGICEEDCFGNCGVLNHCGSTKSGCGCVPN